MYLVSYCPTHITGQVWNLVVNVNSEDGCLAAVKEFHCNKVDVKIISVYSY